MKRLEARDDAKATIARRVSSRRMGSMASSGRDDDRGGNHDDRRPVSGAIMA